MPRDAHPIYAYSDFREFLRDAYEREHAENRKFSHRFIAAKLGLNSSSWFADLLKGRNNLSTAYLIKLAKVFSLTDAKADYFEILVRYNQSESIEEKAHYYKKLGAFREMHSDRVECDKFDYYGQWYYAVVREILFFYEFKGDFEALGKQVVPNLTPAQAREAVVLLKNLDFIKKTAQGVFKPKPTTLKKDSAVKSPFTEGFLVAMMELAMNAMQRFPKDERHVSSLTLSFSKAGYEKALVEVEALRRKLVTLMDEDPLPDRVIQCNFQLFPLSRGQGV